MINIYKNKTRIRIIKIATKRPGIVKYAMLTMCGFLLFKYGQAAAFHQRHHIAYGGECLLLALPLYYHIISTILQDFKAEIKRL